ncbi:right-handed parallel beta-helix repeat-containing protein [Catellatospora sp. TT07R-123]|uniref:right-handed parallel beta-helix repeat-containing protein n=1 Tax=Catellatospora sp. TT07R-123 TaxID=2733863 RepID=UPI001BB34459|nr:right-handed parallel beta-helix repeat-containing protein [Catellatospora sp. TT07R-123]
MKALTRLLSVTAVAVIALLGTQSAAAAHEERPTRELAGTGTVPTYRTDGPTLLVCKTDPADFATRIAGFPAELKAANEALWAQCQRDGYRHLQAAVDAAQLPGTIIKMLPGLYLEEPSLAPASGECKAVEDNATRGKVYGYPVLTWDQQLACPHLGNLVAILGKRDLQIEGTGATPLDVIVDAQYRKLNAIRADNADGVYFRNLAAQRSQFNAFYVMETDGFVLDHTLGRWNDEYAFLTFAVDHGLYTDCEGYGNGDSAIYPGAASNINKDRGHDVPRYAVEIQRCYGHHNTLGYSGTAGDSVWVHDSVFTDNTAGIATDSAFPNHPGMPQNHSKFEHNVIAHNNTDYYSNIVDGTCKKPFEQRGYERGVVCPAVGLPVGTGAVNPGGNYNIWRENWIYDNHYSGFVTSFVPGFVRNDTRWAAQFDTSHHNRYLGNHMGVSEKGEQRPNGLNFWWDGQGTGNCWTAMSDTNIRTLPACGDDDLPAIGAHRYLGEPGNTLKMYACANYDQGAQRLPVDCDWFGAYAAKGLGRIEVKWALGGAVVLGLLAIGLYYRRLRASRRALLGMLLAVAGLTVGVFGTVDTGSVLHPIGLALYGAGFALLGLALRTSGARRLGVTTLVVAALALLGAIDHGLLMIPYLPVSPALLRVLTEFVWIPWALGAVVVARRAAAAPEPAPAAA